MPPDILDSGLKVHEKKKFLFNISTGDTTLDELLGGGFRQDLIHLVYGSTKKIAKILLFTSVNYFKLHGFENKVVFVEGTNRFNPYAVSKLAARFKLTPNRVLDNIMIARAFTFDQMVEILENRLKELDKVKILFIAGITQMWPDYTQATFESIMKAISGIKKLIMKQSPLIVLTAPLHDCSDFKPKGGKYLAHFGNVLVLLNEEERYTEYRLIQHPSMPEKRLVKYKPRKPKRRLIKPINNLTLDKWF